MESGQTIQISRPGFWAIALTLFMVAYNVSVMPVIMSKIVLSFNSSVGYIQGILVLFSLVTASFAPTTENLCRYYGRTRIFTFGLILYGIGIVLTSLSPDIGFLAISFTFIVGLGATPLVSTPWAISDLAFDGKAERQATVALILISTLGGLSGSILGGYIASQAAWRWSFVPSLAVLLIILLLRRFIPNLAVTCRESIDWIGGLLSFVGLGSILIGLCLAGEFGWWVPKRRFSFVGLVIPPFAISIVPTLIAVGVIFLGLFAVWQRKQSRRSAASLMRVGLLKKPIFVFGMLAAMLHTLISTGVQFNLYQFVPTVLLTNPFETALTVIPYTLTMVVVLITILQFLSLGDRLPPKYVVFSGITLLGVGLLILHQSIRPGMTSLGLMPGLIIMGLGSGLFLSYIGALTYSVASLQEKPEGSGIYNPVQNLGSSLGRGILGTILIFFASQNIVDGVLQDLGKTLSSDQRRQAIATLQEMLQTLSRSEVREVFRQKLPPSTYASIKSISLEAATVGMQSSLVIALILTAICFLLATRLPKYPLRSRAK